MKVEEIITDANDKMDIIKSQLKREVPGMSEAELDKLAFDTAKLY